MSSSPTLNDPARGLNAPPGSPLQVTGTESLQQRVLDIRAGGAGDVLDQIGRLHHLSDLHVVCRHLVTRHLAREAQRDWVAGLGSAQEDAGKDGEEPIDGAALRDTHDVMRKVLARPAVAMLAASDFGEVLAQEFSALPAGQVRRYVLSADRHVLSLELRATDASRLVRLYDPHPTATHLRLVVPHPERLRESGRRSLHAWLGPVCAEYFESAPEIVTLHDWDVVGEPASVRLEGFDGQAQLTPHFLRRLMMAGAAAEVRACMLQALARLPANSAQLVRYLQARSPEGQCGLESAIAAGQGAAAAAYVATIANAADWQLSEPNRYQLLRAASRSVEGDLPALNADTLRASADAAIASLKALLAAPAASLSAEHRIDLLLSRPTRGVPLLHALCTRAPRIAQDAQAVQEALYTYVQAIAAAHVLSPRERQSLLAAKVSKGWWRSETAAEAAVSHGNPEAAAAMACGVLESRADIQLKNSLLAGMDLKPGEVLRALGRLPASRRERWKPRLNIAIQEHANPPSRM